MVRPKDLTTGLLGLALLGGPGPAICQAPPARVEFAADRPSPGRPVAPELLPPPPPAAEAPRPEAAPADGYTLDQFIRLGLERNPRLAQAALSVDAARGRAVQAGLYPNPVLSGTFEELNDRQGRGGTNTFPYLSQEIVTGRKLTLSRAAAEREVDQATLALATRRAELLAGIRGAYFDLLALQRRVEVLRELSALTQQSVEQTERLEKAKQAARLDVIQLQVAAEQTRAEFAATEQELPGAFRRLAAAAGAKDLERAPVAGSLDDPLPDYDLDRLRAYVLAIHPDVRSARVGLDRARLVWQRAQAEVIPNVTVSGGYVRQNQNSSNDFSLGFSLPVPVRNRNQGNIQAAWAEVGSAAREVQRVENDLTERVATAYRDYAAARKRAERYAVVRERAELAYRLIVQEKAFTLTAIQRLVSQQGVAQARLEYTRSRGDAWRAASVLSGLAVEDVWPPPPAPPAPVPGPQLPEDGAKK